MKLVTNQQMHTVELEADGSGLTYEKMMEAAGHNLSREALRLAYAQDDDEEIQVLGLVGLLPLRTSLRKAGSPAHILFIGN